MRSDVLEKLDIEFYDYDPECPDVVGYLEDKFKQELAIINKQFAFHEDDEDFIPLRKYFASALRYTLEQQVPEDNATYVLLKEQVGMGLEQMYYTEIVLKEVVDKIYRRFFIDWKHPLLYNDMDGSESYALDHHWNGYYGSMRLSQRVNDAVGIKDEFDDVIENVIVETGLDETSSPKWNDNYRDRLLTIFSPLTLREMKKGDASFERMMNNIKQFVEKPYDR